MFTSSRVTKRNQGIVIFNSDNRCSNKVISLGDLKAVSIELSGLGGLESFQSYLSIQCLPLRGQLSKIIVWSFLIQIIGAART